LDYIDDLPYIRIEDGSRLVSSGNKFMSVGGLYS